MLMVWFRTCSKLSAPFRRTELGKELDQHQIGNRMLFDGNLLHQINFVQLRQDYPETLRMAAGLEGSDETMNTILFLGTYPGLSESMQPRDSSNYHAS